MKKVILFGVGEGGMSAYKYYRNQYSVVGFFDNDPRKQGSVVSVENGESVVELPVFAPSDLDKLDFEKIIIASVFSNEILYQLALLGVPYERIEVFRHEHLSGEGLDGSTLLLGRVLQLGGPLAKVPATINGVDLLVPMNALRMFQHCLFPTLEAPFRYFIETQHLNWLLSRINIGDTVLDVGASCGFLTAAFSKTVGDSGRVVSFEPAENAWVLLNQVVQDNGLANVTLEKKAVSNQKGVVPFVEYSFDESADVLWTPELSSICSASLGAETAGGIETQVECIAIDDYLAGLEGPLSAIKIDIEGFEVLALEGAEKTLRKWLPKLSIDIHKNPFAEGDTLDLCKRKLSGLGYVFEHMDHVLLAEVPK